MDRVLPEITGPAWMVPEAEKLRSKALRDFDFWIESKSCKPAKTPIRHAAFLAVTDRLAELLCATDAKWWCENVEKLSPSDHYSNYLWKHEDPLFWS